MGVSGPSMFQSCVSLVHAAEARFTEGASQMLSGELEDVAAGTAAMSVAKVQMALAAHVIRTANEMSGALLDILA